MGFSLHFVDLHPGFAEAVSRELPWARATTGDIRTLGTAASVAYVSPANGLGFMDGGVDFAYSRDMFPGVEAAVKAEIRRHALGHARVTRLGRPYQPVGSALAVPAAGPARPPGAWLISAPTMFLPHDVSGTRNAYHAFMAALMLARKLGVDELVCPALCYMAG
jgi:O-acetyl-ADP-ribose deacetylase (regulator of RNase III)